MEASRHNVVLILHVFQKSNMFDIRRTIVFCLSLSHLFRILTSNPDTDNKDTYYNEAFRIRTDLTSSKSDLKKTGVLLLEASGLSHNQLKHPSPIPTNLTLPSGLLRELSFALETGQGVPRNELLSLQFMKRAAELGDSIAQGEMFLRYSFGFYQEANYKNGKLTNFSESDVAMGLLYGTFGALGNDTVSQLSLGYRHMIGHGVPRNCPSAIAYYNSVAEKVIELAKIPGTLPMIEKVRLSSRNSHGSRKVKVEQWLQYYEYSADLGDIDAQTAVGQIYNHGTRGIQRDHSKALYYFQQAAEAGNAAAMGHLGHIYANGLSVAANNETAIDWFRKAIEGNDPVGHYGMGYMYLTGYGVDRNYKKALEHFNEAAKQDNTEAEFHLGVMHLKGLATRVSPVKALAYFTAASNGGHLLAMYNLAIMHVSGTGIEPNCNSAVKLLKQVAEQGPWSAVLQKAQDAFDDGDYTYALISYLRAAQMGLELGQSNAAWMLEHGLAPGRLSENIQLALKLYKWSAEQENTNSLLAVGDVFYYGIGLEKDWKKSSGIYQLAEKQKSSRAAFNLGFMYQYGAGLPKDLHLARRYYDLAGSYNADAFYAAFLASTYLTVHEWWETIKDHVPGSLANRIEVLFTCKYAEESQVPPGWWSSRMSDQSMDPGQRSLFGKFMDILDIDGLSEILGAAFDMYASDDLGDILESMFLAALIIVFLLVYRRRQMNRGRQQGNQADVMQAPIQQVAQPGGVPENENPPPVNEPAIDPDTQQAAMHENLNAELQPPNE
eukprot:g7181.t1